MKKSENMLLSIEFNEEEKLLNKKILASIIFVIILIIIIIIALMYTLNSKQGDNQENEITETGEIKKEEISIQEVSDAKEAYKLEEEINLYFNTIEIAAKEASYVEGENKEQEILEKLAIDSSKEFNLKRIYKLEANTKNTLYFLFGETIPTDLENLGEEERAKQNVYYTMTIDHENNTFDIMPYGEEYTNVIQYSENITDSIIQRNQLNSINKTIEKAYYNEILETEVTEEDLVRAYYEDYKNNALYYPEDAYAMIEEEYKAARFSSYEDYQQYVNEQRNILQTAMLSKYSIDELDGKTVYTLVDNYQNTYFVITQTSPMDYQIQLDNYTVKVPTYEEDYLKMTDEQKVATNAHIFIQMINTKDYQNAYNLLDDGFKANYFRTVQDFENYMRDHWFSYNIEADSSIQEQGNTFVYELTLINSSASTAERKNVTIIMQLQEGTDFVMSFTVE